MDNKKKKNKNKAKQEQQSKQQQQQQQNQLVPQNQQHHHDHNCHDHHGNEDHHHDHNHCNHGLPAGDMPNIDPASLLSGLNKGDGLLGSLSMIPKLTEMLNQLSNFGGQAFKPDDPLPDFTKFDQTKQTLEVAIEEFQQTIESVQKKDFTNLTKPVVQKQQQQKLSKQQQQQREKNNQIIKQNIDYLNTLQKDLKKLLQDQSMSGIATILNQGIENLNQDIQYYQKQQEV
ncbi:unnamed protein product [Paramecium pentaurelia]|uniref:Uncharacterized protein n=1 Tax=Paramecium pentaurelia TaxID=43138 RepID=A0A8S1XQQ1_9CILI|nr:unnamed protein product [Paramecium pentaurelia]